MKSPVLFHAHRLILRQCAPMLADLLEDDDCTTISNVKPNIFRHLLYKVYGGRVSFDYLEANAKDIISMPQTSMPLSILSWTPKQHMQAR